MNGAVTMNELRKAIVVTLGTASAVLASGCGQDDAVVETRPRPVQYVQVAAGTGEDRQTYSGVTKSHVDAQISFKVSGTVLDRPVSVGDQVEAGQLLARLDGRDYRVQVQEAQAALASANAALRNAEANFERVSELYENRNASKAELDAARADAESARAQMAAAREHRHGAELQLSYTEIVAPQACTVAQTYVKANENVAPAQPVIRLNCGECPETEAYLPETHIGYVRSGMPVQVTVDAFPGQSFEAVVTEIGVTSGDAGTTFPVTAILSGECPAMRMGMAADLHFTFSMPDQEGRIHVPSVSVGEDRDGNFVFVLEENGGSWHARRQAVVVGGLSDRAALIIAEGLSEGDLVATAGVRRLEDGLEVRLLDSGQLAL